MVVVAAAHYGEDRGLQWAAAAAAVGGGGWQLGMILTGEE
jgi:hypothetical protein